MPSTILKIAVAGGLATAGGGIYVGVATFSPSGTEVIENKVDSTGGKVEEQPTKVPKKPACVIYEASPPAGNHGSRSFGQLLKKFEDSDRFLENWDSRVPKKSGNKEQVAQEVRRACESGGAENGGNVYVWYVGSGETLWNYASDLNKKDWVKTLEFKGNQV